MSSKSQVNVLLVDDHTENLLALEGILGGLGQNLVRATSGAQALKCLLNQDFAVILLDVQMPDMDGFETAALIRQRTRSLYTPIIFLTAFSTSDNMVERGYSLGAVDYLFKPLQPEILKSKVIAFIDLYQKTAEIERQAAELAAINAELKKSEEKFRGLSACSPVGIFLTDINGFYTYTNPSCQKIYGFAEETRMIGEGWVQAIHPDDRERVINDWYKLSRAGEEYHDEFRIITSSGIERWVYVHSSPMRSDKGNLMGHVGTVEDITSRKQAEAEHIELIRAQAARAEAENANRLKDEFLAVLSHELRTPLNSILGWAKLLQRQKFDEKNVARGLEIVERNALLQTQLINDILDVSRIMRGKLKLNLTPVNLESLVLQTVNAVRVEAEAKKLHLDCVIEPLREPLATQSHTDIQGASYIVTGDINRLQQVAGNLLSNALKFTPPNGNIQVKLYLDNENDSIASVPTALIEVRDTGIGISADFLPHVFDRFRQADGSTTRSHNGLGLGLAIVRHLVEMHGGSVSVASLGVNQGATFTVKLPLRTYGQGVQQTQDSPLLKEVENLKR
ncbi:ATP-binding protein [Dulcicalothrix desertica]|uniref:ATP-binding protein n=1 Tax=Dulcicalothrix desertica TaxID=32056 RepID=UPI000F8DEA4D|nr:ATP-binding protein [Dulcicalothrix desertica]TWH39096.1 PAS domain S-box-containing protein [Dulcicalothrix desertica PCC 7102]